MRLIYHLKDNFPPAATLMSTLTAYWKLLIIPSLLSFTMFPCDAKHHNKRIIAKHSTLNLHHKLPQFDPGLPANFTIEKGNPVELPCRISNQGKNMVSWVKYNNRHFHVLSVGDILLTEDERITLSKNEGPSDWALTITKVKLSDSGVYECQIGTSPKLGRNVTLHVHRPPKRSSSLASHLRYSSITTLFVWTIMSFLRPHFAVV
ncbi:uncharacterized protein LOC129597248 isoform X2 [Paramacrobiotus metropolitanus]|uniref:uncharacterized protein LOC129597248 isoform X2 n=1 Tax=Paramacrobiotus metropolitanus TaxID=2943436 RepID=UPI0024463648|nr:uncharacterized protein LOC129597248 isoform X2 [Paramacrobiotus metropolitanus]